MDSSQPTNTASRRNGRNRDSESEDVCCMSLKNFAWRYRGEGNANLVVALPREKIIIRMQKVDYDLALDPATVHDWEVKLKKSVVFYKKIMVPLLGTEFILPPDLARISEDEIDDIDKTLLRVRPTYRLSKGLRLGLVTVQPDYTLLPPRKSHKILPNNHNTSYYPKNTEEFNTFCVEIKPKQGWVPPSDRHHPKCTFCLKQYWKMQKKRTPCKSQYCPLDLFSGDRPRMRRALEGLLETPQNNLKIFRNGSLIYGEGCSNEATEVLSMFFDSKTRSGSTMVDRWCHLVLDALTREFDNDDQPTPITPNDPPYHLNDDKQFISPALPSSSTPTIQSNSDGPCDWSSQPLPPKCILHRVLSVQKLQKADFKSIYSLYKEQSQHRSDYAYVDDLFALNNPPDDVQRYLLSATAKDCSIFVALQKRENRSNENSSYFIKDTDEVTYKLNIGISDIDPKPLSCIGKHCKRDEELISAARLNDE